MGVEVVRRGGVSDNVEFGSCHDGMHATLSNGFRFFFIYIIILVRVLNTAYRSSRPAMKPMLPGRMRHLQGSTGRRLRRSLR